MPDKLVIIVPVVIVGVVLAIIMVITIIIARSRRQRYIAYSIPTENHHRARERHIHHRQRLVDRPDHQYDQVSRNTERENDEEQTVDILPPPPTYNEHRGDVRILGSNHS